MDGPVGCAVQRDIRNVQAHGLLEAQKDPG
jgi:hypothetical protein